MAQSAHTKQVIRRTATVVFYVWSVAIAVNGLHLDKPWMKALSVLPLVLVLLFGVFDQFLWHQNLVLKFVKMPDLRGTWVGTYDSEFIDDNGERQRTSGPIALVIKQTYSDVSIRLLAEKSRSVSTLARMQAQDSGEFYLDYIYANAPKLKHRQELDNHFGSSRLILPSVRPIKFTGEYWTDRLSRGSLELNWVSKRTVSELVDAQILAQEPREEIA